MRDTFCQKPLLIIWDLDGTLYPDTSRWQKTASHRMADVVHKMMLPYLGNIKHEELQALSSKSFLETGFGVCDLAKKLEKSERELHIRFHESLEPKELVSHNPPSVAIAMKRLSEIGIVHSVVTHGARMWADRVLDHVGLSDCFPESLRFGAEDYGFISKTKSFAPFELALKRARSFVSEEIACHTTWVVEDAVANLRLPHAAGMRCIWINTSGRFVDGTCDRGIREVDSLEEALSVIEDSTLGA